MRERIEQLLAAEGLTSARFAELIGVQRSAISHILSGRNNPSFDMIQAILRVFPRISPDWLVMGNGSMSRAVVQRTLFDAIPPVQATAPDLKPIPVPEQTPEPSLTPPTPKPTVSVVSGLEVERVIIFYNDRTFREYRAAKE